MYKPTLYITMEADPEHYNQDGTSLATRLWSFTAPVTLEPSPTGELGIRARMKCSRPYWDVADAVQQQNWVEVAKPYLDCKVYSILDVLSGINVKRYKHYEGSLHFTWLKLDLAPHELRFRLDADAKDNDFLPEVMALTEKARQLLNTSEIAAFRGDEEGLAVYLPTRAEAEALRATRKAEAEAYSAWEQAEEPKKAAPAQSNVEGDTVVDDSDTAGASDNIVKATSNTLEETPEPELAPGLEIAKIEFVRSDGAGLIYNLLQEAWLSAE